MLNNGCYQISSNILTSCKTYIPFNDVPIRQESRVSEFENDLLPTIVNVQSAMKKDMYAVFFRNKRLVKSIELEAQRTVTAAWCTLFVTKRINARL